MFKKIQETAKDAIERSPTILSRSSSPGRARHGARIPSDVNVADNSLQDEGRFASNAKLVDLAFPEQRQGPVSTPPQNRATTIPPPSLVDLSGPSGSTPQPTRGRPFHVEDQLIQVEKAFPAVAESYRAMERIQRSMETLIREQTPFQGLQDLDAFESHLKSLSHQKRASMEEIARLTQLNRDKDTILKGMNQQVEDLKETHTMDRQTKGEIVQNLQSKLEKKEDELFHLKQQTRPASMTNISVATSPESPSISKNQEAHELKAIIQKYSERLDKVMEKARQLHEENMKLKSDLATAAENSNSTETGTEIEKWKSRTKQAVQELKERRERETELRTKIQQLELIVKQPTSSSSSPAVAELQSKIEALQLKCKKLEDEKADQEVLVVQQQAQLQKLQQGQSVLNEKLHNEHASADSEVSRLRAELVEALAVAEQQRMHEHTQVENYKRTLDDMEKKLSDLVARNRFHEEKEHKLEEEKRQIQLDLSNNQGIDNALQLKDSQICALEKEVEVLKKRIVEKNENDLRNSTSSVQKGPPLKITIEEKSGSDGETSPSPIMSRMSEPSSPISFGVTDSKLKEKYKIQSRRLIETQVEVKRLTGDIKKLNNDILEKEKETQMLKDRIDKLEEEVNSSKADRPSSPSAGRHRSMSGASRHPQDIETELKEELQEAFDNAPPNVRTRTGSNSNQSPLKQQVDSLNAELEKTRDLLKQKTLELEEFKTKHERVSASLKENESKLNKHLHDCDNREIEFQKESSDLKAEVSRLLASLDQKNAEVKKNVDEKKQLFEEINAKESELKKQSTAAIKKDEDVSKKLSGLQSELALVQTTLKKKESELETLNSKYQEAVSDLKRQDADINDRQAERDKKELDVKRQLAEFKQIEANLKKEISEFKIEQDKLKQQATDLQSQLKAAEESLLAEKTKRQDAERKYEESSFLEAASSELKEKYESALADIKLKNDGMAKLKSLLKKAQEEALHASQQLFETEKSQVAKHNEEISRLKAQVEDKMNHINNLEDEFSKLQADTAEAKVQFVKEREQLQAQINAAIKGKEDYQVQLQELNDVNKQLNTEKESLEVQLARLDARNSEVSDLNSLIESLREQLLLTENAKGKAESSLKLADSKLSKLEDERRQVSEQLEICQEKVENMEELQRKVDSLNESLTQATEKQNSLLLEAQAHSEKLRAVEEDRDQLRESHENNLKRNEERIELKKELQAIKEKLINTENAKEELLSRLKKTVDALKKLQGERDELQQKVEHLSSNSDAVVSLQKQVEDLKRNIEAADELNNSLRDQINHNSVANNEAVNKLNAIIEEKTTAVALLEKSSADDKDKLEKTINLLRASKNQIVKLQQDCQQFLNESMSLREDKSTFLAQQAAHEQKVLELQNQIRSLTQQQEEHAKAKAQIQELELELGKAFSKVTEEKEDSQRRLQEYHSRLAELESHQALAESQELQLVQLNEKEQMLRQKIEILEQELETSRRLLEQRTSEMDEMRRQQSNQSSKIDSLLNSSRQQKLEQTSFIQRLESQLSGVQSEAIRWQEEAKDLEAALDEERQKAKDLRVSVKVKEEEIVQMNEELGRMKVLVQSVKMQMEETAANRERYEQIETAYRNLDGEIQRIKSDHAEQLKRLNMELEEAKAKDKSIRNMNNTLKDEVRKLQREPKTLSNSNSAMSLSLTSVSPAQDPNVQYLKNVIFRFITDTKKRSHLIPVLSTMLQFTPEEQMKIAATLK